MDWQHIMDITHQVLKAHPDAHPAEQARMIQQQFRDQPVLGWILLRSAQAGSATEPPGEEHG